MTPAWVMGARVWAEEGLGAKGSGEYLAGVGHTQVGREVPSTQQEKGRQCLFPTPQGSADQGEESLAHLQGALGRWCGLCCLQETGSLLPAFQQA